MNPDLEWQRRYEENDTPWDKGEAAPPLVKFLPRGLIEGRVLVPGCGRGHEVRALATSRQIRGVGLDLSSTALAQARGLAASSSDAKRISFVEGDFLNLPVELTGCFDWLVEHTCFCALEPRQRADYVLAASLALKPGGCLFAIFYLNPDTDSGPPFAVSRQEIADLFDPYFVLKEEWVPQESFPGREGRELVQIRQKR